MLLLILRRVLATVPVMAVVAVVVFLLLRVTPGDPAAVLAGDNATLEQIERIRIDLGLDRPIYEQFVQMDCSARRGGSRHFDLHPDCR